MSYFAHEGAAPWQDNVCENLRSGATCLDCHAGGIIFGSTVESERGTLDISQVNVGDCLLTFDHGKMPVVEISTSNIWTSDGICIKYFWPFYIPKMVLGNTTPVIIMPEKRVLFRNSILKKQTGNAYVLVPITALAGYCGIKRIVPLKRISSYNVKFSEDELIVLNGGAVLNCSIEMDFLSENIDQPHSIPCFDVDTTKALLAKISKTKVFSKKLDNIEPNRQRYPVSAFHK